MKKIIIGITIALSAIVTQAASCSWSAGGIALLADSGAAANTYTAYLCDAAVTTLENMTAALSEGNTSYLTSGNTVLGDASLAGTVTTGRISAQKISDFKTVNNSNPKENDTFTFYLVIVDKDTSMFTTVAEKTAQVTGDLSLSMLFGNQSSANTWSAVGVPEPTSGILLLVGGALLALRRRQK